MDRGEAVLMARVRAFVARYVRDDVETTAFCLFSRGTRVYSGTN